MKYIDMHTHTTASDGVMSPKEILRKPISVLSDLESWAKELGFVKCVLETGINQPEAIALYKKCGYSIIENYGQYKGVENSLCFEKIL